jgi:[ribosomal protein S18]-alanine N-acetyltransferase
VTIRPATLADVPLMIDIESASPTAAHWTEQQYLQLFEPPGVGLERLVLVAHEAREGALIGFLVARRVADEWELENIVVASEARRKGLGKRLLAALLAHADETKCASVFLEVRESNAAARRLYEQAGFQQAGFQQTGLRKSYYTNPLEDAVLYRLSVNLRPFSE